jgi:nicotinamidase-related amidase
MRRQTSFVAGALLLITSTAIGQAFDKPSIFELHTRSRERDDDSTDKFVIVNKTVSWDPNKTALIVVDMWDDHWCQGAARRVAELAGPMNQFITAARERGVFVVHCPSTCVDFYRDNPARKRASEAPFVKPPIELATAQRWGTAWCWPDTSREPALPIDDSDMGCDCDVTCKIVEPWTRQIAAIKIDNSRDAITDNGQELFNLFAQRGIENVIICGVHLNMCVLGRPFAIRQLVQLDKNVVLVRDLTDTMYNHRMKPFVDHFAGTDLVIEHVEKYWCPSIESTDLVGGQPFRFSEAPRDTN